MSRIVACKLEALRSQRGLTQRALAQAAGITRQAVGAIEHGRAQPSVGIALALARALGASVEDVFGESREPAAIERVARATIDGRIVAHSLDAEHLAIEPSQSALPTAFVAGCDVAVGLLSRHASLALPHTRVLWLAMTNRQALAELRRGRVHAAVLHGDTRSVATGNAYQRFELATTQEGWLVARGNPHAFRGASDLSRKRLRLVNRPAGAGARRLLDEQLRRARIDPLGIAGYDRNVPGQLDAGRAVAQGFADVAVGMASVAQLYDLEFIALREERCALVVRSGSEHSPEVRVLLEALRSQAYRRDVQALDAYDVTRTGERIA
jgi:putative molybdopterin biosynthesis protein